MIRKEKGITLLSLVITIAVMMIIASSTVYVSLDRFKINNFRKMENDIEFLQEKVSNYYLKYGGLPVLRKEDKTPLEYIYSDLDFEKNSNDNLNYYILDLEALEGAMLNYGEEGFLNRNGSDDVYIINEKTHQIYYVKGIEVNKNMYHTIFKESNVMADNIPPSKPEIKVISGIKNSEGIYTSTVKLEIVPGKDSVSGIEKTTYSVNGGIEYDITTLENNIYEINDVGSYEIKARTYDKTGNISEYSVKTIQTKIERTKLMKAYSENNFTLELDKPVTDKMRNYRIYGNVGGVGNKIENIFDADEIISANSSTVSRVEFGGRNCITWVQGNEAPSQKMLEGKFKENTLYYMKGAIAQSVSNSEHTTLFTVVYTDGSTEYVTGKPFGVESWVAGEFQDILFVIGNNSKTISYIRGEWMNGQNIYIDESTFQIIDEYSSLEEQYIEDEKYVIPVSVEKKGKNLFDIGTRKDYFDSYSRKFWFYIEENGIVGISEYQGSNYKINKKRSYESGTYSISAEFSGRATHIIQTYDENGNILTNSDININNMNYNSYYNAWVVFDTGIINNVIIPDKVAYWYYGTAFYSSTNYEKVTIKNIQIEKGTNVTAYEEPCIKYVNIYLDSPLEEGEYIDFRTGKVVRNNGTTEDLDLPELETYDEYTRIEVLTEVKPSRIEVEYVGYIF